MRDHVHHGRILDADFITVIELVLELFEELLARPFFLHAMVVDRVLVRELDQELVADPNRIRHLVVMKVAMIFQTGLKNELHGIIRWTHPGR